MRFGYSCLGKRLSSVSKQIAIVIGLIALPITMRFEKAASAEPNAAKTPQVKPPQIAPTPPDPRTVRLVKFFSKLQCPVVNLADDFVHAADDNHLDWRLLPSISVIESGGGKAYKNNNIFGWNSLQLFPTIRAGINTVAFKLGKSPLYRNRDSAEKLRIYNPDEHYAESVLTVMNRISPVAELKPVTRVVRRRSEFVYATD